MTTSEMIHEGKEWMEKLEFRKAEAQFNRTLEKDQHSVEAMIWLSRIYLMEKDQEQAQKVLEEALRIAPNHPEVIVLHGVLLMMQAQYEKAIEYLEKARQLNPDLKMIYYNLAKSYRKSGALDQAEQAVRKALVLNAGDFQAHAELSCILFKTVRAKEAISHLQEAIRVNPYFLKAYLILGQLFKTSGMMENATLYYENALRLLPGAHVLREELCDLYALKEEFASAYDQANRLAEQRNLASDYVRVGNYARMLGSFDAAETAFQKAKELNPKLS